MRIVFKNIFSVSLLKFYYLLFKSYTGVTWNWLHNCPLLSYFVFNLTNRLEETSTSSSWDILITFPDKWKVEKYTSSLCSLSDSEKIPPPREFRRLSALQLHHLSACLLNTRSGGKELTGKREIRKLINRFWSTRLVYIRGSCRGIRPIDSSVYEFLDFQFEAFLLGQQISASQNSSR